MIIVRAKSKNKVSFNGVYSKFSVSRKREEERETLSGRSLSTYR